MKKSEKLLKKLLDKSGLEKSPFENLNIPDLRNKLAKEPLQAFKDFKAAIGPSNLSKLVEAIRNNPQLRSEIEDNSKDALPKYPDIAPFIFPEKFITPEQYKAAINEAQKQEKGSFLYGIDSNVAGEIIGQIIWIVLDITQNQ